MAESNQLLISNDELWLKGKNQPMYLKLVRLQLKRQLKVHHPAPTQINFIEQRFIINSDTPFSLSTIQMLQNIPGIHSISPVTKLPIDLEIVIPYMITELGKQLEQRKVKTFAVRCKRANKNFPMNSVEFSTHVGGLLKEKFPELTVDLKHPDLLIQFRILKDEMYVMFDQYPAVGGLPVGSSGHAVSLISGGFDSPVASYLMSRRGCQLSFIFFHAYPYVGDEVKEKIISITSKLSQFQGKTRLHIVPFGEIQALISEHCKPAYRTLLFRHYMVKIAERLASQVKAKAIVTGDALGQVSSQTMENMATLNKSVTIPIFRPLIGHTKQDIILLSRQIGTHDLSVIPHDDACALFSSKNPVITPDQDYWEKITSILDPQINLHETLAKAKIIAFMAGDIETE